MTSFVTPQEDRSTSSVTDIAPSGGASASSQGAYSLQHFADESDGQSRHSLSDEEL